LRKGIEKVGKKERRVGKRLGKGEKEWKMKEWMWRYGEEGTRRIVRIVRLYIEILNAH
jgi:hypothetical protein